MAIKREYQICNNCIMDTSDSKIVFDDKGQCDHCNNFYNKILPEWHPDDSSEKQIMIQAEKIKKYGQKKSHDCLIGISGGIDSSYLTHIAIEKLGLRPLIYHVDAGWNTQQAVSNIESIVDYYNLDLLPKLNIYHLVSSLKSLNYFFVILVIVFSM